MVGEEVHLEGQAEHSGDTEFDCNIEKLLQDQVSNTPAPPRSINGQSPHLGEIFPHHMESTTSDHMRRRTVLSHPELLDVLVQRDVLLGQQNTVAGVSIDQLADHPDIGRARPPDDERATVVMIARRTPGHSGLTVGKRMVSRTPAPVSIISNRSIPKPRPPIGGAPYSSARKKSSSSCIASGSPAAARSDCSTSRSRWITGSTSSE